MVEENYIPIADTDMDRFHKNAPAALARRSGSFVYNELVSAFQTLVTGGLPLAGLIFWDWSASGMFVLLLICAWVGIFCDLCKLNWLRPQAEAFANAKYDDWHVWVVVGSLREGKKKALGSHLRAKWQPGAGVFIDFVFGIISTIMILAMLVAEAGLGLSVFKESGLILALLFIIGGRLVLTTWEILQHKLADRRESPTDDQSFQADRPVKAMVGLRGTGLFLLVFLVAFVTEDISPDTIQKRMWIIMVVLNSLIVLLGLMNASGPLFLRAETKWLRNYMAELVPRRES